MSKNNMNGQPIDWAARITPYKSANNLRAVIEIMLTLVPLAVFWCIMWFALQYSVWLGLIASLPVAAFLVRIFAIQHDCGHDSMFSSTKVNDWVGRCFGILTFTPYFYWRHSHALHHVSSGNLDKRGHGDIETKTVDEYLALSWKGRLLYRLYRNPITLFIIGPAFMFFLKQRLPFEMLNRGWKPWISTLGTNLGIAAIFVVGIYFIGVSDFLILQLVPVFIAAAIGVWLFYVQHQFEETIWERAANWQREHVALMGSSYYAMPKPLMWLTANIGIHHVHHLSSKVPFYKLPKILKDHPALKEIGKLTVWESIRCVPLTLWDEKNKQMISFRALRRANAAAISVPAE